MSGISRDAATYSSPSLPHLAQAPFVDTGVTPPPKPARSRSPVRLEPRVRPCSRPRSAIGSVVADNKWSTKFSRGRHWHNATFTSSTVSKEEQPDRAAAPHSGDSRDDLTDALTQTLDHGRRYKLHDAQADDRNRSKSHWMVAATRFLVLGQFACTLVLRGYDVCGRIKPEDHNMASMAHNQKYIASSRYTATQECDAFVKCLPFDLHGIKRPSPTLFVSAALIWAALSMLQYHINRHDRFQKLAVWVGLLAGLFICAPSLKDPGKPHAVASSLSFSVTTAMFGSEIGHWLYEVIFSSKRSDTKQNGDSTIADVKSEIV